MTDSALVGFIGLGAMGAPLAQALAEAGHVLVLHDRDESRVASLAAHGEAASSPKDVADSAETVFVSLPTPDAVRDVALGQAGLIEGTKIRTYVDLSTTGAVVAREVAAVLAARGVAVVDAPVSGGVSGAHRRSLAVMASGEEEALARVEPLLRTFGQNVFRIGTAPGQGQIAKLLNNLLSATAVAITAEALALGAASDLEPATLLDVFNSSSGRNTATSDKFPVHVLTRRFESGFRLGLMAKDLELCVGEARARHFPLVLGGLVQQLWTLAAAQFEADADHTEFVRLIEEWTHTTLATAQTSAT